MKKATVVMLLICALVGGFYAIRKVATQEDKTAASTKSSNKPFKSPEQMNGQNINVGFNVKGSLSVKEQCSFLRSELEKLKKENIKTEKIWLRLQGGSISQKTYPSDWTDEAILPWAEIQRDFGCQYTFTINFNDTPENQMEFYKRLRSKGITFTFIELGNEQYLPKYALSKIDEFDEVTKRTSNMTAEKYITMCNEYINTFKTAGLPFYVQFAPEKEEKTNAAAWNKAIAEGINNNKFSSKDIHGTIHLYERDGEGSLNEKQINEIRSLVKCQMNMAVTEYGAVDKRDKLSSNELIAQEKSLTTRILRGLHNGDTLLNQVLYTDYDNDKAAVFHPYYHGITPKGKAIFELFKKYW